MSIWNCHDHGVTAPEACCPAARRLTAVPREGAPEPSPTTQRELIEAADAIDGLFAPAHVDGCLWKKDRRMPCQCGSVERESKAVARAREAARTLRRLASDAGGRGEEERREEWAVQTTTDDAEDVWQDQRAFAQRQNADRELAWWQANAQAVPVRLIHRTITERVVEVPHAG